MGYIARTLAKKGLEGVKSIRITVGIPVFPMLAERLSDPAEILDKMGGACIAEYKHDGERVQAHKNIDGVVLFSRRLENITNHYPDVMELIKKYVKPKASIVEGEIVAVDPYTREMLPFQELMHRRRKYGVKEAMEKYPVNIYLFDVLYVNGEEFINKPYLERRKNSKKY